MKKNTESELESHKIWWERLRQVFFEQFQAQPRVFFSPGRLNLLGEHLDYNGGYVMPTAINLGIYLSLRPNELKLYRFYSLDYADRVEFSPNDLYPHHAWYDYLLGAILEYGHSSGPVPGFDLVIGSNLPIGKGLSSSAAVECGLIFALNTLFQGSLKRDEIARLGQKVEGEFIGVKTGLMDQYANQFARQGYCLFLDCDSFSFEHIPWAGISDQILLVDSGVKHSLKESGYNDRRRESSAALAWLAEHYHRKPHYREYSLADVEKCLHFMEPLLYKRAHYVVAEIERTKKAREALTNGDGAALGQLLYQTHQGLQLEYAVSVPEIDFLVGLAKKQPEIWGARLMGGGFGGCTINVLKAGASLDFVPSMLNEYQQKYSGGEAVICRLGKACNELTGLDGLP